MTPTRFRTVKATDVTTTSLLSPCRVGQSRSRSHGFVCWRCCRCDARRNVQKFGRTDRSPRASSCPCDKAMLTVPRLAAVCRGPRSSAAFSWRGCRAELAGSAGSRPRSVPCLPHTCRVCKMHDSVSWRESRAALRHPAAASP